MVLLNATIAKNRVFYPRPLAPMPDILMIDLLGGLPAGTRSPGRFHPILCETVFEQEEFEQFLDIERGQPFPSEPLDARPSVLPPSHTTIAHYGPPAEGWPYVLLCRWPPELTAVAPKELNMFVRDSYTVELFDQHEELEEATERLLDLMKRLRRMRVEIVLPDWSAVPGAAPH